MSEIYNELREQLARAQEGARQEKIGPDEEKKIVLETIAMIQGNKKLAMRHGHAAAYRQTESEMTSRYTQLRTELPGRTRDADQFEQELQKTVQGNKVSEDVLAPIRDKHQKNQEEIAKDTAEYQAMPEQINQTRERHSRFEREQTEAYNPYSDPGSYYNDQTVNLALEQVIQSNIPGAKLSTSEMLKIKGLVVKELNNIGEKEEETGLIERHQEERNRLGTEIVNFKNEYNRLFDSFDQLNKSFDKKYDLTEAQELLGAHFGKKNKAVRAYDILETYSKEVPEFKIQAELLNGQIQKMRSKYQDLYNKVRVERFPNHYNAMRKKTAQAVYKDLWNEFDQLGKTVDEDLRDLSTGRLWNLHAGAETRVSNFWREYHKLKMEAEKRAEIKSA